MPTNTTFRELIQLVDKDFNSVRASQFGRASLYYTVKIDGRPTNILGRKARVPDNNARKFSFLIKTVQDDSSYTTLYLTEIDIINLLSALDETSYEAVTNHLAKIYRDETDAAAHIVQLDREALAPGIASAKLTANRNVLAMPTLSNNLDMDTPFGFKISQQALCDAIWMILSAENDLKLKITVTKYFVFTTLLRRQASSQALPAELAHVRTINDIEEIYVGRRPKEVQRYDADVFTPQVQADFFESI